MPEIINVWDALDYVQEKIGKEEKEYMNYEDYARVARCHEATKHVQALIKIFNDLMEVGFTMV